MVMITRVHCRAKKKQSKQQNKKKKQQKENKKAKKAKSKSENPSSIINHQSTAVESRPEISVKYQSITCSYNIDVPCSYKTATSPVDYDHQQQCLSVRLQVYNDDVPGSVCEV